MKRIKQVKRDILFKVKNPNIIRGGQLQCVLKVTVNNVSSNNIGIL